MSPTRGNSPPQKHTNSCFSREVLTFREKAEPEGSHWSIAYYRHEQPFGKPGWVDIIKGETDEPSVWYELPGEEVSDLAVLELASNIGVSFETVNPEPVKWEKVDLDGKSERAESSWKGQVIKGAKDGVVKPAKDQEALETLVKKMSEPRGEFSYNELTETQVVGAD